MIDLGCETDGNNEICLGFFFYKAWHQTNFFHQNTVEFRYQAMGLHMLTSVIWWAYTRDGLIHGWAYTRMGLYTDGLIHRLKIMAVTNF